MGVEMEPFCPEGENSRCRIPARFVMKVNLKPKRNKVSNTSEQRRERKTKRVGSVLHFPPAAGFFPSSRCQKRMKGVRKKSYGKLKNPSKVSGAEGWCEALKRGAFVPQRPEDGQRGEGSEEGWKKPHTC